MNAKRFAAASGLAVLLLATTAGCSNQSTLVGAARSGNIEVVKTLLNQGMGADDLVFIGSTPLLVAMERNHTDIVKLLVKRGADVNATNSIGETPLIIAIRSSAGKSLDMIKFLVGNGADVNSSGVFGTTALAAAAKHGDDEIVKFLLAKGASTKKFGY